MRTHSQLCQFYVSVHLLCKLRLLAPALVLFPAQSDTVTHRVTNESQNCGSFASKGGDSDTAMG